MKIKRDRLIKLIKEVLSEATPSNYEGEWKEVPSDSYGEAAEVNLPEGGRVRLMNHPGWDKNIHPQWGELLYAYVEITGDSSDYVVAFHPQLGIPSIKPDSKNKVTIQVKDKQNPGSLENNDAIPQSDLRYFCRIEAGKAVKVTIDLQNDGP